ncbi:MAG TPA: LuxR C-terminal-related transcriptional regulator [Ktedonobacteraceae bacterium]|nr:LuxR C-terminal-related transcriptional regulator [Ktedonobacteraceae bacterium]
MELLGRGYDDEAMAQKLGIEVATVRRHRQHLYTKLEVCCESDAILAAYRLHLYSPLEGIAPQPVLHPV